MYRGEETLATTVGALAFSLDPVLGEWFVTIIVAVLAVVGTWTATRIQHRGKPEHAMIDQLQETMKERDEFYKGQIADIKTTAQDANNRATRAEEKATRNERANITLIGYAHRLRNHIELRLDPPAPEWPPEI